MDTKIEALHPDAALIEQLGGTSVVAGLCRIRPPSVSAWKRNGIPRARRDYLALLRPDIFGPALADMTAEIKHRSPQQVARMERARGLRA